MPGINEALPESMSPKEALALANALAAANANYTPPSETYTDHLESLSPAELSTWALRKESSLYDLHEAAFTCLKQVDAAVDIGDEAAADDYARAQLDIEEHLFMLNSIRALAASSRHQ